MSSNERVPQPLVGDVTAFAPQPAPNDPFQALDDLMKVVEALCPTWPARPPFGEFKRVEL